ncbi:hypothetical protein BDZ45DRAFT_749297 [Acephala macrosclerotiorum]|nr:hypothetical protein BDZ45DRAFT_749297 [Acephala macrosclerotiorum]
MATSPEPPQAYVCIASDSLFTSDKDVARAMSSARSDIEELVDSSYTAIFTASQGLDTRSRTSSVWQCQQPPEPSLLALQDCKLWFLFTDGKQDNLATRAQLLFVDKYPCVMVLFGSCAAGPPPSTMYQVCQNIYIQGTDALLLFHDIHTQQVYILQGKGCFATLAKGATTIDSREEEWITSNWYQLCRFRYAQLDKVELSAPEPMSHMDQLTVDGSGSVLTFRDYLARMAVVDVGEKLDYDRLKEIVATAAIGATLFSSSGFSAAVSRTRTMSRNANLNKPERKGVERIDIGGRAHHAIQMIFFNEDLKSRGIEVPKERFDAYRKDLRAANDTNRACLHRHQEQIIEEKNQTKLTERKSFHLPVPDLEETFVPGFVRPSPAQRQHGEYRGICQLCHAKDSLLAFLLHTIDADMDDLEKLKSLHLWDIFNPLLVCDACASHFSTNDLLLDQAVVSTLPLVSIMDNEGAWTDSLGAALGWSFAVDDPIPTFARWFRERRGTFGEMETEEMECPTGQGTFTGALSWTQETWDNGAKQGVSAAYSNTRFSVATYV